MWAYMAILVSCLSSIPVAADAQHDVGISWQVPAAAISTVAAPDQAGGFVLRVATAGMNVRARHCSVPGSVEVQMPDTMPSGAAIDLDAAQQTDAAKKIAYYRKIATNRGVIDFRLVANHKYVRKIGNTIAMPYCVASLEWTP